MSEEKERYEMKENSNGMAETDSEKKAKSSGKAGWIIFSIVLMLLLILALAAIIALAIVLGIERKNDSGPSTAVCLNEGCVQAGAVIKANLDESVDPCENFYQFSCGNWQKSNIIPAGDPIYSTINEAVNRNNIFLRQALEQDDDGGVEAVRKARSFYQSCLNTEVINIRGSTPLLELITNTGGWPLIGIPNDEPWSINGAQLVQEHTYSRSEAAFFSTSVKPDLEDSSANIINIAQGGLFTLSFLYARNETQNVLKQFYVTLWTLLNSTVDQNVYVEAADELVEFESKLAQIRLSPVELQDIDRTNNKFSLGELPHLWPDFDWLSFAQRLFTLGNVSFTVSEDEIVNVNSPEYFQQLITLVRETNDSVLQNYARMKFIQPFIPFLGDDFADAMEDFSRLTSGVQGSEDRDQVCIRQVQSYYPIAIARPFVNNSVPGGTKETVSMMLDYINEAFKERLDELTWLDETTRERSKEKVDEVLSTVAYPDQLFDDDYLNGIYKDYVADPYDFFGNYLNILKVLFQRDLKVLRQPVDTESWPLDFAPTDLNAYYDPQMNRYIFFVGILVPPFFRANWPDYLNFGAIGNVMGHELTHGFDSEGQGFDKDGVRRQWWTNASQSEFVSRLQCFVDQYNNYESYGAQVNGQLTLAENIADNGGLNTAFQAYRKRMNNGGMDMKLPSLDYTPDQLFFISYSQLFCNLALPSYAEFLTRVSVHSPGQSRVIGPLVNNPEFAEAFNCPVGSPMNPPTEEKCFLW